MKLRGIDFSPILDASGVQGFFGGVGGENEYRHHKLLLDFVDRLMAT